MMSVMSYLIEQILRKGRVFQVGFLAIMVILTVLAYYLARQGKVWDIRPLEAFELINEGIGRAAEMGRPIVVLPGISSLRSAQTMAGLTMFGEISQKAADIGVTTTTVTSSTQTVAALEAIAGDVYSRIGKPELYQPGKYVKWFGGGQFVYAIGAAGHILEEKPGFVVQVGYFLSDVIVVGETASRVGALQIGGTADQSGLPLMAICCDSILFGEEIYAASASITGDVRTIGTLAGEDWVKVILLALMTIGVLAWAAGSEYIYNLMGM